ncbi:hypothetical protein CPAV1605_1400 [seawater metagenome]|uniref:Uncharacterized protein n=1 Tax=seawater metagenome TaxID=1561972 RepID=A0A5E8CKN8_9ZZZZ
MKSLKYLNIINTINLLLASYISQTTAFGGKTNKQVTEYIESKGKICLFPKNKAFAIWGLIYFLLILFSVVSLFSFNNISNLVNSKVSAFYFLSTVFTIAWLILFARRYKGRKCFQSLAAMTGILFSLGKIYISLAPLLPIFTFWQKLCYFYPFSIYFGWIIIAFILNLSYCLREGRIVKKYSRLERLLYLFFQLSTIFISALIVLLFKDYSVPAVFCWALYFIYQKSRNSITFTLLISNLLLLATIIL